MTREGCADSFWWGAVHHIWSNDFLAKCPAHSSNFPPLPPPQCEAHLSLNDACGPSSTTRPSALGIKCAPRTHLAPCTEAAADVDVFMELALLFPTVAAQRLTI